MFYELENTIHMLTRNWFKKENNKSKHLLHYGKGKYFGGGVYSPRKAIRGSQVFYLMKIILATATAPC